MQALFVLLPIDLKAKIALSLPSCTVTTTREKKSKPHSTLLEMVIYIAIY